jgi:hypothetical protein
MMLGWSKNEEPKRPRLRGLPRNRGQPLGHLDGLLPFL